VYAFLHGYFSVTRLSHSKNDYDMAVPMTNPEKAVLSRVKEFRMTDGDFARIQKYAMEHTGISLSGQKKEMIYSRLAKRIRLLKLEDFSTYCDLLSDHSEQEISNFVNAITTNLTSFFREEHHFEFLKETVVRDLKEWHQTDGKVRVWSAGCSTGEEPYSIAIALSEAMLNGAQWDIKVLATDLDTCVLKHGSDGVYDVERLEDVPERRVRRFFRHGRKENSNKVYVKDCVRNMISFKQLNLMKDWPMRGKFDVIFCRNVVIYFDKPTQRILFDRYANALRSGGYLFIGHSENLNGVSDRFESLGRTIYRKGLD